jgi:hypothetical protein
MVKVRALTDHMRPGLDAYRCIDDKQAVREGWIVGAEDGVDASLR